MTTNPDEGSRVHQRFVVVEGGVPVRFDDAPLRWLTDSGQRPTDEWLRAQTPPYYGWVEADPPAYDPLTERVEEVPLGEIVPNPLDGTVTRSWRVVLLSPAELSAVQEQQKGKVTAERDRRLETGFFWNGTRFDARPEDKTRIAGAAQLAFMYLTAGGDPAAVDWNEPGTGEPFSWIAQDNSRVNMTAPEVIDFAKAAAKWERKNIDAARALKDDPNGVPANYTDDMHWPDPATFLA